MKTNNSLLATLLFGLVTLTGCSDIEHNTDNETPASRAMSDIEAEEGINPDDQILAEAGSFSHNQAFIYTQGNEAGINHVYMFRQNDNGSMEYMGKTPTGGAGTGAALGSQGSVVIDRNNGYLYLANAGDNSISSFQIREDGTLSLIQNSPSEGTTPVSIAINEGLMYVVHSGSSSIAGFRIGVAGDFQSINGSYRQLSSANASPGQITFAPNGKSIYITEKATNTISRFRITPSGRPGPRTTVNSVGNTPTGFGFGQSEYMLVSNGEYGTDGAASMTSYDGVATGNLTSVNDAVSNSQTGSGAIANTKHGFYSFVSNTGSSTISSYYVRADGSLLLITPGIPTGVNPVDIALTTDNLSAYVLCADQTIHSYLRLRGGNLHHTDKIGTLTPTSTGLAIW